MNHRGWNAPGAVDGVPPAGKFLRRSQILAIDTMPPAQSIKPTRDSRNNGVILLARAGNQLALEALIKEYQTRIARYVIAQTGQRDDYEDLCQTVFVKMVLNLPRLKSPETFESWLFTIARNVCIDHLRRRKWRQRLFVPYEPHHDSIPATMPAPADTAAQTINSALERMRPDQRDLLKLVREKNRNYKELARISGISIAALKSRLFRARESLRRILNQAKSDDEQKKDVRE